MKTIVLIPVQETTKIASNNTHMNSNKKRFHPVLCVTHRCNLNCIYCYQKHDNSDMSFETAKKCIDLIFQKNLNEYDEIEIGLIGGEPLLNFELIKAIFNYTEQYKGICKYYFFATTNGTVITDEMKEWFQARKKSFILGLSIDGTPETHNHNRSNSFNKIDIDFFIKTWGFQGVKMTLTDFSLEHLAENIKYLHSIGINNITGANLYEGTFNWEQEKFIKLLIPQLEELVQFYVINDNLPVVQMLNKHIDACENTKKTKHKYCGIGTGTLFFDTDGTQCPCGFFTPMTFDKETLKKVNTTDFSKEENFVDDECFEKCYIQPICPNCAGNNYLANNSFKEKDKSKCRIQKLIALYAADLLIKRMVKNPEKYSEIQKIKTLKAARRIKELYLPEFEQYCI